MEPDDSLGEPEDGFKFDEVAVEAEPEPEPVAAEPELVLETSPEDALAVLAGPKINAGFTGEVINVPYEAWCALAVCLARQSRMRRFFRHVPPEATPGGDKYSFRLLPDRFTVEMNVFWRFGYVSGMNDTVAESKRASEEAHRRKEIARSNLERAQIEAAPYIKETSHETVPEPGTVRAINDENRKRFLANIDKAVLELEQATSDAESAAASVLKAASELSGAKAEIFRFTLDDIAAGRVLPVFPKWEVKANVA